jgi:hypothetical protein
MTWWERCKLRNQECWLGFPEYFVPPPLGTSIIRTYQAHVANGDAARQVLYHYDFEPDGEHLTLRGHDRLAEITAMLQYNGFPVVIERTPANPALAEKRRQVVLNELARGQFPVPAERVLIGQPLANGLRGPEAVVIYRNLLSQTAAKGPPIAVSGGTVGPVGGEGGGGTGGATPAR